MSAAPAKRQIFIRRIFKHPIHKVWGAVATEEGLSAWLMPVNGFELRQGAEFVMKTKPQGKFDGMVHCRILKIEPLQMISFTWESNVLSETVVTIELQSIDNNQTLLRLSHYGFKGFSGFLVRQILDLGWRRLLRKKLKRYLVQ